MRAAREDAVRKLMLVAPSMGRGGAERQAFLLLDSLDDQEWAGALVTLDSRGQFFEQAIAAGHRAECLSIKTKLPILGLLQLRSRIREFRPDVLLLRGFSATTLTRIAALTMSERPLIAIAEHATGRQAGRSWFHDLVDRILAPMVDVYIGVARGQLGYLTDEKRLPPTRVRIIHNGIDCRPYPGCSGQLARERLGLKESTFVVGVVAAMRPEKDHQTLLRALTRLIQVVEDAKIVLLGDGPMRSMIEEWIAEQGLAEHVLLLGARDDVELVLPAFDVLTLSSNTVETLPLSVLEGMACGLPIVATRVGGLPELVVEGVTGLLVPPRDAGAIADAWIYLHQSPAVARDMGCRGRERCAKQFSAESMARAYERLFLELLADREASR